MGKGGGGSTNTVQKADPWIGIQSYLSQLYGGASQNFAGGGPQYYPNSTVAPQADATNQALAMGQQRATQGSPLVSAAQNQNLAIVNGNYLNSNPANAYLSNTANGGYLNNNPYLDAMYKSATNPLVQQFQQSVAPGIASQFSAAGRFGSGAQQQAFQNAQQPLAQGLASAASSIYGGAYQNERNLQQQAAQGLSGNYNFAQGLQQGAIQNAPTLANQDYANIAQLMGIGQYQQGVNQNLLNSQIQRWDYNQNQPLANLQNYNALLQGGTPYASRSTTANAPSANPFAQALGTGLAGNALYQAGNDSGLWSSIGSMFGSGAGEAGLGAMLGGAGAESGYGGLLGLFL